MNFLTFDEFSHFLFRCHSLYCFTIFYFFFIFLKKIDHDEQQEITPPFFNQCQCQCTRSANSMFSLKNLEIIIKLFYGRENCLMFPIKALTKTSFKFSKEDSFCEKVHYYLLFRFLIQLVYDQIYCFNNGSTVIRLGF